MRALLCCVLLAAASAADDLATRFATARSGSAVVTASFQHEVGAVDPADRQVLAGTLVVDAGPPLRYRIHEGDPADPGTGTTWIGDGQRHWDVSRPLPDVAPDVVPRQPSDQDLADLARLAAVLRGDLDALAATYDRTEVADRLVWSARTAEVAPARIEATVDAEARPTRVALIAPDGRTDVFQITAYDDRPVVDPSVFRP
jgi:hypothetical protein